MQDYFAETVSERSASTISLTWTNGAANGGAPVLDYRITYDQSAGDYIVLASGLNNPLFTATGLTSGNVYKFKVESRNKFGYSAFSQVVSILCAAVPSTPDMPISTVIAD